MPKTTSGDAGITLRLSHTAPYDWSRLLGFLAVRAVPGLEAVEDGCYQRTVEIDGTTGSIAVRQVGEDSRVEATIRFPEASALPAIEVRLRRLLDLDADARAIVRHLARDPWLSGLVRRRPGLRVPGTWDAYELATRAILGQQVSVAAARTLTARLVAAHGTRLPGSRTMRLFPTPARVASADLGSIGVPRARAEALSRLAQALVDEPDLLSPTGDLERTARRLQLLPGIGPWTAQYVAMRALREPDAFPASDLGLLRAAERGGKRPSPSQLAERSRAWSPWRAYAVMHLWTEDAERGKPPSPRAEGLR